MVPFMSDSFPGTRRGLSSLCECTGSISGLSAVGVQDELDVTIFASKSLGLFGGEAPGRPTCVMEREEGRRDTGLESGFRRGTQVP